MNDDQRPGRYQHVRRRTPSAPMAALSPTSREVEVDPEMPTTMGPRTRDEVLLRALARIERIDTEMESAAEDMQAASQQRKALLAYQRQLSSQLTEVSGQLETIKEILTDVLGRLPE